MFQHKLRTLLTSSATALSFLFAAAVSADDTEIFLATPPTGTNLRPNILFVIDTSGSMSTNVTTQIPYDPARTYTGACPAGRVYWKTSSQSNPPGCTGNQWVSDANFVCQSARATLNTNGYKTQGPAAQWVTNNNVNRRKWKGLARGRDASVECKEDANIPHGDGSATGLYPANGSNGPFTNNVSQTITWDAADGANGTYTFYTSNWLNWRNDPTQTSVKTRLQIVQEVANTTLDGLSEVNVGLMRYSTGGQGGMVVYPMTAIETARTPMKALINSFTPNGVTPLSETYYESYLYWAGAAPRYGLSSSPISSIATSMSGGRYISPIGGTCQKNFTILLTDGEPNQDQDADSSIEGLTSFQTLTGNPSSRCTENGADGTGDGDVGDGRCLDDLAAYMNKKDFVEQTPPSTTDATENVVTYTIGFGTGVTQRGIDLLQNTADRGGGQFFLAGDTAELTNVFENIIQKILSDNVSFTSPTVSVNAFNRTQNLNDLFITVFQPKDAYSWAGNLKKYRLSANGTILDAQGRPAVDESKGFFADGAESYWSGLADGPTVTLGGAAHEQPSPAARRLFTDLAALAATPDRNLTSTANSLSVGNGAITADMLGMPATATAADRDALIEWLRGADIDDLNEDGDKTDPRFMMGDPIHARPVSVIYGGSPASPNLNDAAVFVATNDGYLHAINPSDGSELWAYLPSELLHRAYDMHKDDPTDVKRYGLDGSIRAFKLDRNNDGVVDTSAGDKVYLFFGMGRGGSNYYALDVTDKSQPRLLWRHGAADTLIGLAQSWSTPIVARVDVSGATQNSDKLVVLFGGGYDPTQDNVPYNTDDSGNRLFMLDAISGNVLWHAGPSAGFGFDSTANFKHAKLNNSIPADLRVLDLTNDGFADRIYAADTGGRVWRFDITNGQSANNLVVGGVFASLGVADGTGTSPADARRFYNAPDVALLKANGSYFINIAIGSGFRGHPLNTEVRDRFYSLRDPRPFTPMTTTDWSSFTTIQDNSTGLVDVTTNVTPTMAANSLGWKMELSQPSWRGEKVLAEARTFGGNILFTTFVPTDGRTRSDTCVAHTGINRLYIVAAADGRPYIDRDGDGNFEAEDRGSNLDQSGIAPEAAIFFPSPDDPNTCTGAACSPPPACLVGVESCGVGLTNAPVKTIWRQQGID